MVIFK
jgi:hypothetical protein